LFSPEDEHIGLDTCRELEINKYIERHWCIKLVIYQERKNIFVPSDSKHMMTSSMRCKHGCVVRIPPSIDRVLRNGFPA
jgi:hypothetical protein